MSLVVHVSTEKEVKGYILGMNGKVVAER